MPNTSNLSITVGADPELFVIDKTGKFVSADGFIRGTKDKPFPVNYGATQVDGVAAEFNIAPCVNSAEFVQRIFDVQNALKAMLPVGYNLKTVPVAQFDEDIWNNIPGECKLLGCNPDYNAWTGEINDPPNGDITRMRTGAGHIHIGWTSGEAITPGSSHFEDCKMVVKQLDYYIGCYSLLWDTDSRRRTLYGKAGAFRPKPYGVEYRTPSNMWLKSPELVNWIFNSTFSAIWGMVTGERDYVPDKFKSLARDIIDENQTDYVKSSDFKNKIHKETGLQWPKW